MPFFTGIGGALTGQGGFGFSRRRRSMKVSFSATGGTITNVGAFTIHTFTSSGTFVIDGYDGRTIQYLIVAGGGADAGPGAGGRSGGGGAGGVIQGSTNAIGNGTFLITVGGGGSPGGIYAQGTNGSNSVLNLLTAIGGGAGGFDGPGNPGGSGGGSGYAGSGGLGTTDQGFPGANSYVSTSRRDRGPASSGGGGAGGAGNPGGGLDPSIGLSSGPSLVGGPGGNGIQSAISGSVIAYAGGGKGEGAAGDGNDGAGQGVNRGGSGDSGVVIIRYLT